jgi:D-2-hydroxyacid dehydrogenase (NADP+)
VIGAGGIGREVGRLGAALGMRVVGIRRTPASALPPGSAAMGEPDDVDRFLAESDFAAVCCQWTPGTTKLINAARLAAMKPDAVLVNVARRARTWWTGSGGIESARYEMNSRQIPPTAEVCNAASGR